MAAERLIVGPFNRVEGDLEVRLDVRDGQVRSAEVVAPMYRGFEQMLVGRSAMDALVVVPRICGICSVSQSVAAAQALAEVAGVQPPPNGQIALNLMLATEIVADHLTHFYLFFMPDFCREAYAGRAWADEVQRRFAPGSGEHQRQAIAARQRWFMLMGLLGGKWPHTHSVAPGGSSRAIDAAERLRLLALVRELRGVLERQLIGDRLETLTSLDGEAALQAWMESAPDRGDLRLFLRLAADLDLGRLGRGPGLYLSHGAYVQPEDGERSHAFARGVWDESLGKLQPLDPLDVREDASHAWLNPAGDAPRHPSQGQTEPRVDKPGAYSWNKAPRLGGRVLETGAIARQLADGHPLVRSVVAREGGTVRSRVIARVLELARLVSLMETWLQALRPGEPFHAAHEFPDLGQGCGLVEAARGALGHWLRVEHGRIAHYQIVAPTSWNFSPRDAHGQPGALEAALVGAPVQPGERTPVAVQHIVRSFDPCMVCTVH